MSEDLDFVDDSVRKTPEDIRAERAAKYKELARVKRREMYQKAKAAHKVKQVAMKAKLKEQKRQARESAQAEKRNRLFAAVTTGDQVEPTKPRLRLVPQE